MRPWTFLPVALAGGGWGTWSNCDACAFVPHPPSFDPHATPTVTTTTQPHHPTRAGRRSSHLALTRFGGQHDRTERNQSPLQASKRKDELLLECEKSHPDRSVIQDILEDLRQCSPIQATAASPKLQKHWTLVWTTEQEINFFLDWGFSNTITQTIREATLCNRIPFVRGGSFEVTGSLSIPDAQGIRTDFAFDTAELDLRRWGTYKFPPIGTGWFDTVYLDDDLRVDVNSRNDILICRSCEQQQ